MAEEQLYMNDCIICSRTNPASIGARFYNIKAGVVEGVFSAKELHASYKGRVHGGIIAAILDEAMARTLWTDRPEARAVTANMEITYLKPVPIGLELRCMGRMVSETEKTFSAEGEIYLPDGLVAAKSRGVYVFQNEEQIYRGVKIK